MRKLTVGIPTNEKLYPAVEYLLTEQGIKIQRQPRRFFAHTDDLQFVFARMSEITRLIKSGLLDCGFVTKDHWYENDLQSSAFNYLNKGLSVPVTRKEFPTLGCCNLVFIARKDAAAYQIFGDDETGVRGLIFGFIDHTKRSPIVATRFPKISARFLLGQRQLTRDCIRNRFLDRKKGRPCEIKFMMVGGAEELYVLLGAADFAIAQVESGDTIRNHDLYVVEVMLKSCLLLVGDSVPGMYEFASRLSE